MIDNTLYFQIYPDEGQVDINDVIGTYIPTSHVPVTAVDQYRTYGIYSTNLQDIGASFADTQCARALSKIAEGGFSSYLELSYAETALQAMLLNEIVFVIRPAVKINGHSGIIAYVNQNGDYRTDCSHDIFSVANSRDWIVCPDFIELDHEDDLKIINSKMLSKEIGRRLTTVSDLSSDLPGWNNICEDAIEGFIADHQVPAYLSDKSTRYWRRGDGFQRHFYKRMKVQWDHYTSAVPPVICSFALPPLIAIVLDRLNNRQDLKSVLKDLREELAPARAELLELNRLPESSLSQGEVEERTRYIDLAFDAIVPESRLSGVEKRHRTFSISQKLARSIIRKMAAFVFSSGQIGFDDIVGSAGELERIIKHDGSIVDRTVTSRLFVDMIKTESLQALVAHHFSEAEIRAIDRSLRDDGR